MLLNAPPSDEYVSSSSPGFLLHGSIIIGHCYSCLDLPYWTCIMILMKWLFCLHTRSFRVHLCDLSSCVAFAYIGCLAGLGVPSGPVMSMSR